MRQLKFGKSWPFEKHFPLYMAFNAIKIRKLYYGAKTLDSLSYRKIRAPGGVIYEKGKVAGRGGGGGGC